MTEVTAAMVRVAIAGAGGRMGRALIAATLAERDLELAAALDVAGSPVVGRDAGERFGHSTGVIVTADIDAAVTASDVLIDFTRPDGTIAHVGACARHRVAAVIGTTGLSDAQRKQLATYAETIPIVYAPNMSVGINVLAKLVETAARQLGSAYDIEIVEMHHRHKIDAPSGTAIALGEAAARGAGRHLRDAAVFAREGVTGERPAGAIGFATLRGGDVVGEHTVIFAGTGERVELTHRAASRQNFAAGALRAVRYVAERRARGERGLAGMDDVLGLRS